ncbi:Uncharacterised protein [uncultured archaeon]|nr:Uncharacterised protein [uncultured archaeon]
MSLPTGLTVMFFKTFLQRLIYQFGKLVIVIDQGPLDRFLLGSVADKVIRNSRIPVIAVPVKDKKVEL